MSAAMTFSKLRLSALIVAGCFALAASVARAAPQTGSFNTFLSLSALPAGQTAVAAIVFDVAPGYHAQSHTPLNDKGVNYIAFNVKMDGNPALEFLDPIFPPGRIENSLTLGMQSVYTGQIVVFVPIRIKADAPIGDTTISGTIIWQACNSNTCFAPERKPFTISTHIVSAMQSVNPADTKLFSQFDQSVFAKGATTAPATLPAEVVQTLSNAPSTSATIDIFGYSFSLGSGNILLALPVALGTGILFNLMPCVLPVIPLKAIGFYEVSKHSRGRCLFLGLVFSAGLLAVFVVLALLLVALKSLSWGQQFSNGWFIWGIVILLTIMAMGMFGLFEVVLPDSISNLTPSHDSAGGNFAFGILAALLSTPCTAPMFAGLLAWAVAQPVAMGMFAIITVGVGMALPYLALSAFPNLARKVPRTGPWSLVLKQMMGFLLLAVAVYFAGGRLVASREFFWGVFAVVAAGMLFMVIRTIQLSKRVGPRGISLAVAVIVVLVSCQITIGLTEKTDLDWQPYSQQAFENARASGQPVLVEFTANWCGNCLALEETVYHDHKAISALHQAKMILLRADLTDSDAPGWKVLNDLNPGGGIPLTAIYWPRNPQPSKLTSLYTTGNLLDVLNHPAGKS
jgi:thiol:disulfide interchange protein